MRKWVAIALWLAASTAQAGGVGAVRKQAEVSMLVRGEISVDVRGEVDDLSIERPGELPAGVVDFVDTQVRTWKFRPMQVEGRDVAVRNRMRVLVVAKKRDDGNYGLRLQAVGFDPLVADSGYEVASRDMKPPPYPVALARAGASGTVYLVIRVGRDGTVREAFAEQVNLKSVAAERVMKKMRDAFAVSAVGAARDWLFTPPSRGELAGAEYWTVRTPVDYTLGTKLPKYGEWVAYVPGPRLTAEWADQELVRGSPEALADGGIEMLAANRLRLLTPLGADG